MAGRMGCLRHFKHTLEVHLKHVKGTSKNLNIANPVSLQHLRFNFLEMSQDSSFLSEQMGGRYEVLLAWELRTANKSPFHCNPRANSAGYFSQDKGCSSAVASWWHCTLSIFFREGPVDNPSHGPLDSARFSRNSATQESALVKMWPCEQCIRYHDSIKKCFY